MRYLISFILLIMVVFLTAVAVYCVYAGFAEHWSYFLVGLSIAIVDLVASATLFATWK